MLLKFTIILVVALSLGDVSAAPELKCERYEDVCAFPVCSCPGRPGPAAQWRPDCNNEFRYFCSIAAECKCRDPAADGTCKQEANCLSNTDCGRPTCGLSCIYEGDISRGTHCVAASAKAKRRDGTLLKCIGPRGKLSRRYCNFRRDGEENDDHLIE